LEGLERLYVQANGNVLLTEGRGLAQLFTVGQQGNITIDGRADIFGAGKVGSPGGGLLPSEINFTAGNGTMLTFSEVTGTVSGWAAGCDFNGPDGGQVCGFGGTHVLSLQGISGIKHNSKSMFLVGVFVDDSVPADPAPPLLDVSGANDVVEFAPLLNQSFFVGDGRTASGQIQEFHAPAGATRVFFGFAETLGFTGPGLSDALGDNGGALSASYTIRQNGIVSLSGISVAASEQSFLPPPGEFSSLVRNADGSFTRTLKNGTKIHYDANGLQTSIVDHNGNTTQYAYDANSRLTSITDPVGKVTTLSYTGDHLASITDPATRTTRFEHDSAGDLRTVTFPDGSSRSYAYDGRHLMTAEIDARGFATTREYDHSGRVIKATLPDGSVRRTTHAQTVGLVDPASGLGTALNPAPIKRPEEAVSTFTDGEDRSTTAQTGQFGEGLRVTDPAGLDTKIERDTDGNPTKTVLFSGHTFNRTYDESGNLITLSDQMLGGVMEFTYEPVFNALASITDPDEQTATIFDHDANGNLSKITTPTGRKAAYVYNPHGLQENVVDVLNTETTFHYDLTTANLLKQIQTSEVDQREVTLTYWPEGYLKTFNDPLQRVFDYSYDVLGRMTNQGLPDGEEIRYEYDLNGNLSSVTPPNRPPHIFTYTPLNQLETYAPPDVGTTGKKSVYTYNGAQQLVQIRYPDADTVTFEYDNAGRIKRLILLRGSVNYSYDAATGQVKTIISPDAITLTHDYRGELLAQQSWAGDVAGNVSQGYDAQGRLNSSSVNGAHTVNFQYDDDGLLAQAGNFVINRDVESGLITGTALGYVTDIWAYNSFGELRSYTVESNGTDLYAVQFSRDKLGRITDENLTIGGVSTAFTYGYDAAGRLDEVKKNDSVIATYTFDSNGNRQTYETPSVSVVGTYDAQDRVIQYGETTYTYTDRGELATKTNGSQVTSYAYDATGTLLGMRLPDGMEIDYVLDGRFRRIGKKVDGVLVQGFLYQDRRPVAELDGNGDVISRFIYANDPQAPEYMVKDGETYRIITDQLGSPRLVVNTDTGVIAQRIDYDEFGRVILDTNPGFQPFGFGSGIYDSDTHLVRLGIRDYDAEIGRWTTPDPTLFDGNLSNLYVYAKNDSINLRDITGLKPAPPKVGDPFAACVNVCSKFNPPKCREPEICAALGPSICNPVAETECRQKCKRNVNRVPRPPASKPGVWFILRNIFRSIFGQ